MISRILSAVLLSSSLLLAIEIHEMPEVKERVMPEVSKTSVFSFYESVKDAKKAVVNISTQKKITSRYGNMNQMNPLFNQNPLFKEFFGDLFGQMVPKDRVERSLGSGVIISSDGYIVTNNHVIDGADTIVVNLPGSTKEYEAKLIGKDPKSDIAVVKIDAKDLNIISFANSSELQVGDIVFAIGNPFGVGETVTQGIISALNKSGIGINDYENFIQTDASINPGNSGGALVDTRGALIGINTAILSKTGGNHGVGFAIPADMVKKIALTLVDKGKVDRGFMGVTIQNITDDNKEFYEREDGALITSISEDSPAEKAGLKIWDLIIGVDGKAIKDAADLKNKIGSYEPGSKIKIDYLRDKKRQTTYITLDTTPESGQSLEGAANGGIEGLALSDLSDPILQKYRLSQNTTGVAVVGVEQDSKASELGFQEGDLIIQVENYNITNLQDLKEAMKKLGQGAKRVLIKRRGVNFVIVLR